MNLKRLGRIKKTTPISMPAISKVWQFFEQRKDQVICKECHEKDVCKGVYKRDLTGSTGPLKRHLKIEHPLSFALLDTGDPRPSDASTSSRPKRLNAGRKKNSVLFGDGKTVTETMKFRLELITLVKNHPALWNKECPDYQKVDAIYHGWEGIGEILSKRFSTTITGDECKKFFESQRSYYRAHRKRLREQPNPTWPYWTAMQFLTPMYDKMESGLLDPTINPFVRDETFFRIPPIGEHLQSPFLAHDKAQNWNFDHMPEEGKISLMKWLVEGWDEFNSPAVSNPFRASPFPPKESLSMKWSERLERMGITKTPQQVLRMVTTEIDVLKSHLAKDLYPFPELSTSQKILYEFLVRTLDHSELRDPFQGAFSQEQQNFANHLFKIKSEDGFDVEAWINFSNGENRPFAQPASTSKEILSTGDPEMVSDFSIPGGSRQDDSLNEPMERTAFEKFPVKVSRKKLRAKKRDNIKKILLMEELKRSKLQTKLVRVRLDRAVMLRELTRREFQPLNGPDTRPCDTNST